MQIFSYLPKIFIKIYLFFFQSVAGNYGHKANTND